MAWSWATSLALLAAALAVNASGSGLRPVLLLNDESLGAMRPRTTAPQATVPVVPSPRGESGTGDVDVDAQLRQAADAATMSCEFLKSVIEDLSAGPDLLTSMVSVGRSDQPAQVTGAQVLTYWVNYHSIMASVQSWIAAVDPNSPDDVFSIGQAVYKLIESARYDVVDVASLEEPFKDFLTTDSGLADFRTHAAIQLLPGQELDLHLLGGLDLTDELAARLMPPAVCHLFTMTKTDPTDVVRIENTINAIRQLQLDKALCGDLYLRIEALATYLTVLDALLPLISTHPRYAEIHTTTNPVSDTMTEYLSTWRKMQLEIIHEYLDRRVRRHGARNRPPSSSSLLHRIRIALAKAAVSKAVNVDMADLTTPIYPRSEPRPRPSLKKRRKRRTKKKATSKAETDVDVVLPEHDDKELEMKRSMPAPSASGSDASEVPRNERSSRKSHAEAESDANGKESRSRSTVASDKLTASRKVPESKATPAEALKAKLRDLPSRMADFVGDMLTVFTMRESRTRNSLVFFDKQSGAPVFSMHRPHGGKQKPIRNDVLGRIRDKLRMHFDL